MPIRPDGIAGRIAALDLGACFTVTTRVPTGTPRAAQKVSKARAALKNHLSPYVARARRETRLNYAIETTVTLSHDYSAVLVSATVTRIDKGR